jgi:Cu(I)/Ag(I) efflux system membrane fusion protein
MKSKVTLVLGFASISLFAVPVAQAQCCGGMGAGSSCPMSAGTAAPAAVADASTKHAVLAEPAQSVFDSYVKIQTALAQDSFSAVQDNAATLAKVVQGDSAKALPAKLSEQATALANAKDLSSARAALKPFSRSLIDFLKTQNLPVGSYYEVYCPMADASWVQTDKTVANPYFGKAMLHCGQVKS